MKIKNTHGFNVGVLAKRNAGIRSSFLSIMIPAGATLEIPDTVYKMGYKELLAADVALGKYIIVQDCVPTEEEIEAKAAKELAAAQELVNKAKPATKG